jgi:hypothetical protein
VSARSSSMSDGLIARGPSRGTGRQSPSCAARRGHAAAAA